MRQEDLNEMMRLPWERQVTVTAWCQCPKCRENYCGDGVLPCTECQHAQQQVGRVNVANATPRTEPRSTHCVHRGNE